MYSQFRTSFGIIFIKTFLIYGIFVDNISIKNIFMKIN